MFELKPISKTAIPGALAKAERYRFLNEPRDAESICRDVLRADAENQDALITLLLTLTDQFGHGRRVGLRHARELLPRLTDEYNRHYYAGMIYERWAKTQLEEGTPGFVVYDWLKQAIEEYDHAASLRESCSETGDESLLRHNACARIIKRHDEIRPRPEDAIPDAILQDDVPM